MRDVKPLMFAKCPECNGDVPQQEIEQLCMDPYNGIIYECVCGSEISLDVYVAAESLGQVVYEEDEDES